MEVLKSKHAMLLLWAALLSQNLLIPVMSAANFEDQKNYYPPSGSYGTPPSQGSGGGHATPTPSHGGGSGSYGGSPPANCGTPPSGGHGHHRTSPSTPSGGGGYYHSPPTSTPSPTTPTTPTPGSGTSPTTPIVNPPIVTTPGTPSTPGVTTPSPPFSFGPVSPPFTCIFWRNHPTFVWGLIGWLGTVGAPVNGGTVGGTFGVPAVPGFSPNMNVLQALSSTRTDGYGELYREGTAAFLNSMAHAGFPYSTTQVRDSFIAAFSSNKAASAQAQLFKLANEGRT